MARITDYASLSQAIQDFAHRASIAPYVDYLIQRAENRIYSQIAVLNEGNGLQWMEATLAGAIDANTGKFAVPADYFSMKGALVQVGQGSYGLIMKESPWIYAKYPLRAPTAPPSYIAREGSSFIFGPYPDSAYTVSGTYYSRGAALSSDQTTSWMTENIPEVLHSACMAETCRWLKDVAGQKSWAADMTELLSGVCLADKAQRYAGGTLVMDTGAPMVPGGF